VTETLKTAVASELQPLRSTPSSNGRNATREVGEVMSFRFLDDAPFLVCLRFSDRCRASVSPPLLARQYRPTTWCVQWSLTNSKLKVKVTVAGCTVWAKKNKISREQKKLFRWGRGPSSDWWQLTDDR